MASPSFVIKLFILSSFSLSTVALPSSQPPNFTLQCAESWALGVWTLDQFPGSLSVHLTDPQCNAFTGANQSHAWIRTNFTRCRWVVTATDDVITMKNTAVLTTTATSRDGLVGRDGFHIFDMVCRISKHGGFVMTSYDNYRSNKTGDTGDAFPSLTAPQNVSSEDFQAEINFYTNHHFVEEAFSPFTVTLGQPLYVIVRETTGRLKYRFTVPRCMLVPSGNQISVFVLLFQGCVVDPGMKVLGWDVNTFKFSIITGEFFSLIYIFDSFFQIRIYGP